MAKKKTAKKGKAPARKRGRPSAYREEYAEQARKLCRLGLTDKQLGEFFGVSEQTVNSWKNEFPEFLEALKKGKEIADNRVERALFERAVGYSHPEDKIFQHLGKAVVVPTIKHYPPDTVACIFWLKNRKREEWRDKPPAEEDPDRLDLGEEYTLNPDGDVPDEPIL